MTPKIPLDPISEEERTIVTCFYDDVEDMLERIDSELMKSLPKTIERFNHASTAFLEQLKIQKQ